MSDAPSDPIPDVPVMDGGFRVWCLVGCGWWREAPAISLGRMLAERTDHMANAHTKDRVDFQHLRVAERGPNGPERA